MIFSCIIIVFLVIMYYNIYLRYSITNDGSMLMSTTNELFQSGYMTSAIEWIGEQIPGGFFIYRADNETELLYVNSAVEKMYGCDSDAEFRELTGYTFKGMVYPQDYEAVENYPMPGISITMGAKLSF